MEAHTYILCNGPFRVYIKGWSAIMEMKSPKYCTYRGHEGGDCTNILPPMGGVVHSNVTLLNCFIPHYVPGVGAVVSINWSITYLLREH